MKNFITGDPGAADAPSAAAMREAWLRLAHTPGGPGRAAARRLLRHFGLPHHIFAASHAALLAHAPDCRLDLLSGPPSAAMRDLFAWTADWLAVPGHRLLTLADDTYPPALLTIADPPLLLYAAGNSDLLLRRMVAVVGSRNASRQGELHACRFAGALSDAGWTVVSGLALGIDSAAHAGSLRGRGGTVAVIGTGIDLVYPARNRALSGEIVAAGCIVSEFAPGTPPLAVNFPRRNRIISGLSRGVLVVEAAIKSGSLITARVAAEQGRDVFAIPGAIDAPLSRGCHHLIRLGAKLVESAQDIFEEIGASGDESGAPAGLETVEGADTEAASETDADARVDAGDMTGEAAPATGAGCTAVLSSLGHAPTTLDQLAHRSGLPPAALLGDLLLLELAGKLEILPGGAYRQLVALSHTGG